MSKNQARRLGTTLAVTGTILLFSGWLWAIPIGIVALSLVIYSEV
jgi:hypothetical protein